MKRLFIFLGFLVWASIVSNIFANAANNRPTILLNINGLLCNYLDAPPIRDFPQGYLHDLDEGLEDYQFYLSTFRELGTAQQQRGVILHQAKLAWKRVYTRLLVLHYGIAPVTERLQALAYLHEISQQRYSDDVYATPPKALPLPIGPLVRQVGVTFIPVPAQSAPLGVK